MLASIVLGGEVKSKTIQFGLLAMFLTGFSALLYQVIWIRSFSTLLGGTSLSLSCVIAHFMLGLGLGNRIAPEIIKRSLKKKLALYAICEWFIVALVALSFFILFFCSPLLVSFLKSTSMPRLLAHFVLTGFLVFPPTFLMGFSFPLISYLYPQAKDHQWLYAANCVGGAVGGFFSYTVLIANLGLHVTLALGLLGNLIAGFIFMSQRFLNAGLDDKTKLEVTNEQTGLPWFSISLSAFSGFVLLSLEQVWFRLAGLFLGGRIFVHSLVLTAILLCLGAASFASPIFSRKNENELMKILFLALAGTLLSMFVGLHLIPGVLPTMIDWDIPSKKFLRPEFFGIMFFAAIIPSILLGICFPLAIELAQRGYRSALEKIKALASILYLNTAMSVVGSLLTTYLLFPYLGTISTYKFFFVGLAAFAIAAAIAVYRRTKLVIAFVTVTYLVIATLLISANLNPVLSPVFQAEDEYGYVSINQLATHVDEEGNEFFRWGLFHNYVSLVGAFGDKDTTAVQYNLALYPALLAKSVEDVLVVGMGFGLTSQAFLKMPEVQRLISIELLPDVMKAQYAMSFHDTAYLKDPRAQFIVDDGRSFIFQAHQQWDVISVNIDPYGVGATGLYSQDFYKMVRSKLKPGGIYTQMIYGARRDLAHMLKTARSGFAFTKIMPGYPNDGFILLAANEEIPDWASGIFTGRYKRARNLLPGRAWNSPSLNEPQDFAIAEEVGENARLQVLAEFPAKVITDENLLVETNRNHFWDLFLHYPDDYY